MRNDVEDILEKYKRKLEEKSDEGFSGEYKRFKEEQIGKELGFYEKSCNFCRKGKMQGIVQKSRFKK